MRMCCLTSELDCILRMSIEIEEKDVVTTEFPICSVEYDQKNKFIYSGAYELLDGETRYFQISVNHREDASHFTMVTSLTL